MNRRNFFKALGLTLTALGSVPAMLRDLHARLRRLPPTLEVEPVGDLYALVSLYNRKPSPNANRYAPEPRTLLARGRASVELQSASRGKAVFHLGPTSCFVPEGGVVRYIEAEVFRSIDNVSLCRIPLSKNPVVQGFGADDTRVVAGWVIFSQTALDLEL